MEAERMSVDEMEAGRELDALVAEKVMGAEWHERSDGWSVLRMYSPARTSYRIIQVRRADGSLVERGPRYSTDIAAAWEVVEKLWALGYPIDVGNGGEVGADDPYSPYWRVVVTRFRPGDIEVVRDTAPHAICLAALKAVRETTVERARRAGAL